MKYMLDANICIYIIRKKPPNVLKKLQKIDISNVVISSITLSELEYGAQKSKNIVGVRVGVRQPLKHPCGRIRLRLVTFPQSNPAQQSQPFQGFSSGQAARSVLLF
jgi:hypothetical protein